MKPIFAIVITLTLLIINGCSEQQQSTETEQKDHVLKKQVGAMQDAKAVTQTINAKAQEQDDRAANLAGH